MSKNSSVVSGSLITNPTINYEIEGPKTPSKKRTSDPKFCPVPWQRRRFFSHLGFFFYFSENTLICIVRRTNFFVILRVRFELVWNLIYGLNFRFFSYLFFSIYFFNNIYFFLLRCFISGRMFDDEARFLHKLFFIIFFFNRKLEEFPKWNRILKRLN